MRAHRSPKPGTRRAVVARGVRRYVVCGLRRRSRGAAVQTREAFGGIGRFIPGATLVVIALISAYVIGWPPMPPDNPQHRAPIVQFAGYSFADFAQGTP